MITIKHTFIQGAYVIQHPRHVDPRGHFEEIYNAREFKAAGLPTQWLQDNVSFSHRGVIRGIHINSKHPQGKLMRCAFGAIRVVCVDLRPSSPTFGEHLAFDFDAGKPEALFIPPGCGAGFSARTEAVVHYKCTTLFVPEGDGGVYYSDPDLKIDWAVEYETVSLKDQSLPHLVDYQKTLS